MHRSLDLVEHEDRRPSMMVDGFFVVWLQSYLKQQQQQSFKDTHSYEPSESLGPDVPNTAAQAELLRAEQLSLQHNSQLAFYAQAKA